MSTEQESESDELIRRVRNGDESAISLLLDRHRRRLRQMVKMRMDDRLVARIDPSDVIQDALADAVKKLPEYIREQPIPFYPWLRRIAWNRLIDLHRQHILAERRSVDREIPSEGSLSDQSACLLAGQLAGREKSPSDGLIRMETIRLMQLSIARLSESHREILVLRHLEGLSVSETAAVLNLTEIAVASRHFRALERLRELLQVAIREGDL